MAGRSGRNALADGFRVLVDDLAFPKQPAARAHHPAQVLGVAPEKQLIRGIVRRQGCRQIGPNQQQVGLLARRQGTQVFKAQGARAVPRRHGPHVRCRHGRRIEQSGLGYEGRSPHDLEKVVDVTVSPQGHVHARGEHLGHRGKAAADLTIGQRLMGDVHPAPG